MNGLLLKLAGLLSRVQQQVVRIYRGIPGHRAFDWLAAALTRPIRGLANLALRLFPKLKEWEWLLEIQRIRIMHPTLLLVLLAWVFYRGARPTDLGHIGTDFVIYPYFGALSYFNPFLGMVSAAFYGMGDVIQKLIYNDIFGSEFLYEMAYVGAYDDPNYRWGIVGYCVAYSSLAVAGLLPGILARVFRMGVRKWLARYFYKKTAAVADGARLRNAPVPDGTPGQAGANLGALYPGGTAPVYPLAELVASMAGAGLGTAFHMHNIAPILEKPAFYLRPNPDISCHDMEVTRYLQLPATRQGITGPAGGGPLLNGLILGPGAVSPGTVPPGGAGRGPGPDGGPDEEGGGGPDEDLQPLVDPRNGDTLIVHDGGYEGGRPGQVWLDGEWRDRADAAAFFRQWEQDYQRDRQQWFRDRTQEWEEELARKRAEEGLDYDPYQDAWRKPPPPVDWAEVPPEDPDLFRLQKRPGDPGRLYRWLIGPSDVGYEKFRQHLDELDTHHDQALDQYRNLVEKHRAAAESGDPWLEDQYRRRRAEAADNLSRIRGTRLDLTGRFTSRSRGGAAYNRYIQDYQKMSWDKVGQAGKELVWDPVAHVVKPDLGGEDGPLARSFRRLKDSSDRMRLRARQQPELDARFQDAMDEVKVLTDQLRDAEVRGDTTAIQAIRDQLKGARDQALEANHRRGDLANRTRDWERSAAQVTHEYLKMQADRSGAAQAQYQALRAGSRVASRLSGGAFDADPPELRQLGKESEAWQDLQDDHAEEFRKIRRKMGPDGDSTPLDLTPDEMEMDRQFQQRQWVADRKIARYEHNRAQYEEASARLQQARRSGNPQELQDALQAHQDAERRLSRSVKRNLADPHVKAKLKGAPDDLQDRWSTDAETFRTQPLREGAVDIMNRERSWVVEESPGTYRRIEVDDLKPVSGSRGPGQDLDLAPNKRIIDARTGQRVPDADLQGAVNQAAKKMRMDPARQDIHVVSDRHPAAYRVRSGETPQDALSPGRVRDAGPMDGEHYHQVSEYKRVAEAGGDLPEKVRGAVKDYKRFTEPMLERHPGARRPRVLSDRAMEVMDEVGNRTRAPGTGNAEFRRLTGMDLDEGARKLNSMQETVPTLDSPSRRIEIARSRGTGTGTTSTTSDLKSLVGDTGPTLKTDKAQRLHDYLQKRDVRSFMDEEGRARGFGRKPEPELTNTGDAVRARARDRGMLDPQQEAAREFAHGLDDVMDKDPVFKQVHDRVHKALGEGVSRRIDEVRDLHQGTMVDEGGWGDPSSRGFQAELQRRLERTPLDGPRTTQHQQRALFQAGVSEQEFDLYMDVRQKVWRGDPVGPVEPPDPATGTTPYYLEVDRRLGGIHPNDSGESLSSGARRMRGQ